MRQCKAWLNGMDVGTAYWDAAARRATVYCTLPEGWIYRAVLLLEGREIANSGVLLPDKGGFSAELRLPHIERPNDASLHCEVLRSEPGERKTNGFELSQFSHWNESALKLEPAVALQIKRNSQVFYRIYNQKRYLLLKLDLITPDSSVAMYVVGKPIEIANQWYLYLRIDNNGKPIPWGKDEK